MATIELTPTLILSSLGMLASLLVATFALSRRSRGWDEAENLRKKLEGDDEKGKKGLIREFEDFRTDIYERQLPPMRDGLSAVTSRVKSISRGLSAHRSGEREIEEDVRGSITAMARDEASKAAQAARKRIIGEVARQFDIHDRASTESFTAGVLSAIEESDPFPSERGRERESQPSLMGRLDGRLDTGRGFPALPPPAQRRRPTQTSIPREEPESTPPERERPSRPQSYNPDDTGKFRDRKP